MNIIFSQKEIDVYKKLFTESMQTRMLIELMEDRFAAAVDQFANEYNEIFNSKKPYTWFCEDLEVRDDWKIKFYTEYSPDHRDLDLSVGDLLFPQAKIALWKSQKKLEDAKKAQIKEQQRASQNKKKEIDEKVAAFRKSLEKK